MIWTKKERETILEVCRSVRKWAERRGGPCGECYKASARVHKLLRAKGIDVKVVRGVFWANMEPSHNDCHFWNEYKGIPFDVTADQFNSDLKRWRLKGVPKILVGVGYGKHYLDWGFQPIYA